MPRTLIVLVREGPDVLTRIASLCRRRAFVVESLTIGRTEAPGMSRVTLFVDADQRGAHRLVANLERLVDVARAEDVTDRPTVVRDLAMIKVAATPDSRADIMQLVQVFRAQRRGRGRRLARHRDDRHRRQGGRAAPGAAALRRDRGGPDRAAGDVPRRARGRPGEGGWLDRARP